MTSGSLSSRPPRLSVVWAGRNRASSIEDALNSVLALGKQDLEIVIEDGGSTDGTLEILHRYAEVDDRLAIVSRPHASAGRRLLRGLRRCRGDVVVVCPETGRFLPHAMTPALEELRQAPHADALLCGPPGDFDIVSLLFGREQPLLGNVLMRRQWLIDLGLAAPDWAIDCLDFDILRRLATEAELRRAPIAIAAGESPVDHPRGSAADVRRHIAARFDIVDRLFADVPFLAASGDALRLECKANQLSIVRERCGPLGRLSRARVFRPRLRALAIWRDQLDRLDEPTVRHRTGLFSYQLEAFDHLRRIRRIEQSLRIPTAGRVDLYRLAAPACEERGQVSEAASMWRRAEALHDPIIDSLALQTFTKCPDVADADLVRMQKRWAARHVPQARELRLPLPQPYDGRRRIRIAYHCAFMDSDTVRYMMKRVIAAHDRSRFEVYGYSPAAVPDDLRPSFDVVRDVRSSGGDPHAVRFHGRSAISDDRFVDLVRADAIDVFIELSGFSPGHRLTAMARRCAPVQIFYINHTSRSMVPNIDGFVSDAIASPIDDDGHSEQLIRLPHCLFCYDYRETDGPPVVDPPSLARGFVTFGCFGGGQKINLPLIRLWADLLERVPNSILRLQSRTMDKADTRRFLRACFARCGIDPERILALPGVDRRTLLDHYGEIDISLDTWPYNGGSTIAESLWHGVPVVGFYGTSFASRYGTSILQAAGCRDLVGNSPEEYVAIAARLAADPERLRSLRHRLREMCSRHGLNDSTRMARSLETVFQTMVTRLA
jgi:predicted O-linked N-acetylglucosamine transferase (SPINDLY family)